MQNTKKHRKHRKHAKHTKSVNMKKIQKKQKIKKSKDQKIIQEKIIRNIDKRVQKQKNRNNKKIKKI